jgi:5-oxoprolinase (ATP-hydrolysing)
VYFQDAGRSMTPIYLLEKISPGTKIVGPAMIIDQTQTIVVKPGSEARILTSHVIIDVGTVPRNIAPSEKIVDPIQLSIFGHRFMSIAEQMGRTLQKTSISLNIKERYA